MNRQNVLVEGGLTGRHQQEKPPVPCRSESGVPHLPRGGYHAAPVYRQGFFSEERGADAELAAASARKHQGIPAEVLTVQSYFSRRACALGTRSWSHARCRDMVVASTEDGMNPKEPNNDDKDPLDVLVAEITGSAQSDEERLRTFHAAFERTVRLPADGYVIGEPVSIVAVFFDGNVRRGLTALCRREDRSEHVVPVSQVTFAGGTPGARLIAAYRHWLGLEPADAATAPAAGRTRRHKAQAEDLDLSRPVELVVLSSRDRAVRCRLLGTDRVITLRPRRVHEEVPGEILTVQPLKQWGYARHPYLSGEVVGRRLDVAALGLVPLGLEDLGFWDPAEEYWGEEGDPIEDCLKPIIARGRRPLFEMEQILPGEDPKEPWEDPISRANDLVGAGDRSKARRLLMDACQADLRCLDSHAHLGNLEFDYCPQDAARHYEVGVRIGELSLGDGFDGVLQWGWIDNRPFLRCMHGYALALWRLNRHAEAAAILGRILWLNPTDNQGIRFLIDDVRAGKAWTPD